MSITSLAIGFFAMLALMFLSLPVAFCIIVVGTLGGFLAFGAPLIDMMGGVVWGTLNNSVMTAVPLFMLLGEILLRGGIADKMFDALSVWLGRLPGGLLHTNIGTCALFSATSGSSVATAATVGTVALPALQARNYPVAASLGSLAAGGTLGILIPPSVNLLVYGSLANVSVGQLFMAGVVPGLLLTALFSLYILVFHGKAGSADKVAQVDMAQRIALLRHLVPPGLIFLVVMGSIYGGLATPTESAALGVVTSLFFVWRSGRLKWALLEHCFMQSAKTTGMVILIIVCALMLNVTLSMLGTTQAVTQWVATLGLTHYTLLLMLVMFYIVLGMFMDAMSMLVLTVPIAVPMVVAVGVDPVWFGIFIVVMCEIALITPPVGMNLFVVQGLRKDGGSFGDVVRGALPYVFIMIAFTGMLIVWPQIALWLRSRPDASNSRRLRGTRRVGLRPRGCAAAGAQSQHKSRSDATHTPGGRAIRAAGPPAGSPQPAGGPFSIENAEHRAQAEREVLAMLRTLGEPRPDAIVMACFDDLALQEARKLTGRPVVGTCEASIAAARAISARFAIVTTVHSAVPGIRVLMQRHGAGEHATVHAAGIGVAAAAQAGPEALDAVVRIARTAIRDHGAEAVLLASGGLTTLGPLLSERLGVPVVDGVQSAIAHAVDLLRPA